jgi:solute carrier family 25 citrate transporter 1
MTKLNHKTTRAFVSGALGGTLKTVCTLPLDVIKTTQQVSTQRRSILQQAKYIHSIRGLKGFFVGADVALTAQVGKVGIQFAAFQTWESILQNTFLAGVLAGVTEALIWTTPSERIKIVQQAEVASVSVRKFANSKAAIRSILQEQGVKGFFIGFVPTAIRQGSSLGVRFFTYSECKLYLLNADKENQSRLWHAPLSGAVCGVTSAALNQPIDVVKTKMMSYEGSKSGRSTIETLTQLVRKEGVAALYKGFSARGLKIAVGQAIVFGVYGNLQQFFSG